MISLRRLRTAVLVGGWLLVLLGVGLRFYELDERGTTVSDAMYYTNIAQSWADGEPIHRIYDRPKFYRPVPYALFGWALRFLGPSDASIKYVNAGLDSLSVLLLFAIAWLVARDAIVAVALAASYALLPMALLMSRIEFVHVSSAATILLSLLFFVLHLQSEAVWPRRGWIFLCGAATGLASLTHEELLLLAIPYSLLLLASRPSAASEEGEGCRLRDRLGAVVMNGAVYGLGLALVCRSVFHHYFNHGVRLASPKAAEKISAAGNTFHRFVRFLGDSIVINTSVWVLALWVLVTVAVLGFGAFRWSRGRPAQWSWLAGLAPTFLVTVQMLVFSRFFDHCFVRVVFPLTPLVLLGVFSGLAMLVPRRLRSGVALAVMLGVIWSSIGSFGAGRWWSTKLSFHDGQVPDLLPIEHDVRNGVRKLRSAVYEKVWSRRVFDLLEDKVDEESRLLVTPSILYSNLGRRVFQLDYYFGDDAIYVGDHTLEDDGGLGPLVARRNVRYLLFTTFDLDRRLRHKGQHEIYLYDGRWRTQKPYGAGALYGIPRGEYAIHKEWRNLWLFLRRQNPTIVGASRELSLEEIRENLDGPRFFVVFELPAKTYSGTASDSLSLSN